MLPDFGDDESDLSKEGLAPKRIRGNGLAPIGIGTGSRSDGAATGSLPPDGLALSESIDLLLLSVCLLISRIAEAAPEPLLWVTTVVLKPTLQRFISWLL